MPGRSNVVSTLCSSTSATALASPFGVVYQGRSAGTPVPGARVSLFADSATGALVPLKAGADAGLEPNNDNANPFASDGGGRFSFVLSTAQAESVLHVMDEALAEVSHAAASVRP